MSYILLSELKNKFYLTQLKNYFKYLFIQANDFITKNKKKGLIFRCPIFQ